MKQPNMKQFHRSIVTLAAIAAIAFTLSAEAAAKGRLLVETVHFKAIENTVTNENPDRTVAVYLPPSYASDEARRFPVLYLLHGIGGTEKDWTRAWGDPDDPWGTIARLMDHGIESGRLQEMIIVMMDQMTRAGGSFYTDSTVTGRWEELTTTELPAWTDGRFRTIPLAASRGIAGHSMGGYGAIMLGMKHPDTFSVVYGMSPSTMSWGADLSKENPAFRLVLERKGPKELASFYEAGIVALSQAYSPNPQKPPFFVNFPFRVNGQGDLVPDEPTYSSWNAHFPAVIAERYRSQLMQLRGIRFDAGTDDQFAHIPLTARGLSKELQRLEVPHIFEEYNGDHRNRLWGPTGRLYTEVLPWFSMLLEADATPDRAVAASKP